MKPCPSTQAGLRQQLRSIIGAGGPYPLPEIQDLDSRSWDLVRRAVIDADEPGERLVALDSAQNLYGRDLGWTLDEERRSLAGFKGRALTLSYSYRLPPALIPALNNFRQLFCSDDGKDLETGFVTDAPIQLSFGCDLRWHQVPADRFEKEVTNVALEAPTQMGLNAADIAVLVARNDLVAHIASALKRRELTVKHVFGDSHIERRQRRQAFWKGQTMLVWNTHSFKGWEQRGVVLAIDAPMAKESADPLVDVYVALTRVKASQIGEAALTVVCADERLRGFGARWFEPYDNAAPSPPL